MALSAEEYIDMVKGMTGEQLFRIDNIVREKLKPFYFQILKNIVQQELSPEQRLELQRMQASTESQEMLFERQIEIQNAMTPLQHFRLSENQQRLMRTSVVQHSATIITLSDGTRLRKSGNTVSESSDTDIEWQVIED